MGHNSPEALKLGREKERMKIRSDASVGGKDFRGKSAILMSKDNDWTLNYNQLLSLAGRLHADYQES
jgi:hypothetical protein